MSLSEKSSQAPAVQVENGQAETGLLGEHVADGRRQMSAAEKRLVRKQDLVITTLLSTSFFFAYFDRGAIGNARIMGLQEDLNLSSHQYFNCLMAFYVGYIVFEFPAFLLIRRFSPPTVFGVSIIIFGVAGLSMAFAKNFAHVFVLRVILGFGEATVQTAFVFASHWYTREELAVRCGYIYGLTPVAGAITGLISYGIQKHLDSKGPGHMASWQWLFIIEGSPTILWGFIIWVLLPDFPDKEVKRKYSIWFRTEEEKQLIIQRSIAGKNVMGAKINFRQVWEAALDPKVWAFAIVTATISASLAGFGVFLPTFIKEFGFSSLVTQLYTVIPYSAAFICMFVVTRVSQHYNKFALPVLAVCLVAMAGFVIIIATPNAVAGIVASSLISGAVYPGVVICAAWLANSNAGYTKRVTASSITQVAIQTFTIMCTQIYTTPPRFFKGHGVLLGLFVLTLGLLAGIWWLMRRSNRVKDEEARRWADQGLRNPDEDKTLEELCDKHPNYRYVW